MLVVKICINNGRTPKTKVSITSHTRHIYFRGVGRGRHPKIKIRLLVSLVSVRTGSIDPNTDHHHPDRHTRTYSPF